MNSLDYWTIKVRTVWTIVPSDRTLWTIAPQTQIDNRRAEHCAKCFQVFIGMQPPALAYNKRHIVPQHSNILKPLWNHFVIPYILFQPGTLGGDRHAYSISSVSSSHEGSYSCVAENVLGQAQQVAYLAVSGQGGGGVGGVLAVILLILVLILY